MSDGSDASIEMAYEQESTPLLKGDANVGDSQGTEEVPPPYTAPSAPPPGQIDGKLI